MGRTPCCDESGVKKGPWTPEEDDRLVEYINKNGHGSWRALPKLAGLNRCGKSCRLRWTNYLRPDIKRGNFTPQEEQDIINLHALLGNKWSAIASHLPGRTDNEIKNFWNTHLRKKLLQMGIDPVTHRPRTDHLNSLALLPQLLAAAMQPDAAAFLTKIQLLHNMVQAQNYQNLLGNNDNNNNNNNYMGLFSSTQQINPSDQILPPQNSNSNGYLDFPNQNQLLGSCVPNPVFVNQNQNTLPPLVSESECLKNSQNMESSFKVGDASNPSSSTVSTQEANWRDIFDADTSDPYWKDIIEEASSTQWPF